MAPTSGIPVTVESAVEGRLDRFLTGWSAEDGVRHVWAVALIGSFDGEGVVGHIATYTHHVVILDFKTGAYVSSIGSG